MDKKFLKIVVEKFNRSSYSHFVKMFQKHRLKQYYQDIGNVPLPAYLHDPLSPEEIYSIIDFYPFGVFRNVERTKLESPSLIQSLESAKNHFLQREIMEEAGELFNDYSGLIQIIYSIGIISNISGLSAEEVQDIIIPKYEEIGRSLGLNKRILVGYIDGFFDKIEDDFTTAIVEYIKERKDGLRITFENDQFKVDEYSAETVLNAGVTSQKLDLLEPIFTKIIQRKSAIIQEFEYLLNNTKVKENELEKFMANHFQDVFGAHYERIETQLWLRFPNIDINNKGRRLDIFLRNSISNDWDLYELKRLLPLVKNTNDQTMLSASLNDALQQIRNYSKLLSQDSIKQELHRQGIEYYEPSLNVVIGRNPQIHNKDWRQILKNNASDVKVITYDNMISEMKVRLADQSKFLDYQNIK